VRHHPYLQARRKDGLTGLGGEGAGVGHVRAVQHDPAAVATAGGGAGKLCARMHRDVAITSASRGRAGIEVRRAVGTTWHAEAREQELRVRVVEQTLLDQVEVDRQRRGS